MTLVVTGLIAWAIRDLAGGLWKSFLYSGAILITGVVGTARILVDAHWLTDVIASLALGTLWLTAVVSVSEPRSCLHPPTRSPSDRHPSIAQTRVPGMVGKGAACPFRHEVRWNPRDGEAREASAEDVGTRPGRPPRHE
jgi:hypothetical protein